MSKLFIYIPTYNRPEALNKQLTALIPQIALYPQNVRLMISDNNSNNYHLYKIINSFPILSNVEVRQNSGNIGGNANIALGFIFAHRNEFLWILSDNDIISNHAISFILNILDDKVDFYSFCDESETVKTVIYDWNTGWSIPMKRRIGLISATLYNMASAADVIEEAFFFHNSSFPHMAVGCAAARKKGLTQFCLVPINEIIVEEALPPKNLRIDYSFAQIGMPLLSPLFPKWEAKQFCREWLISNGITLHIKKSQFPHLYIQTRATLIHYGGMQALVLLWATNALAILVAPYLKRRSLIVEKLKLHLDPLNIRKLKLLRSFFFRKSH